MSVSACITSVSGPVLLAAERAFLREAQPWGVILMGRSCVDKAQVRALTAEIKDALGREAADLGSRAGTLSSEIADLGQSHHDIAQSLHPETAPAVAATTAEPAPVEAPATPEPISVTVEQPEEDTAAADDAPETNGAAAMTAEDAADETPHEPVPAQEPSLSDRIRALRDGASA